MTDRAHDCPAPNCGVQVPHSQLACKRHWFMLPADLRREVWAAFREDGQGSRRHVEACLAARDWLEQNVKPPAQQALADDAAATSRKLDRVSSTMSRGLPRARRRGTR